MVEGGGRERERGERGEGEIIIIMVRNGGVKNETKKEWRRN